MHSYDGPKHDDNQRRRGKARQHAEDKQEPTKELANDNQVSERSHAQHRNGLLYAWTAPRSEEQLRSMGNENCADDHTYEGKREMYRVAIRRKRRIIVHVGRPLDE